MKIPELGRAEADAWTPGIGGGKDEEGEYGRRREVRRTLEGGKE